MNGCDIRICSYLMMLYHLEYTTSPESCRMYNAERRWTWLKHRTKSRTRKRSGSMNSYPCYVGAGRGGAPQGSGGSLPNVAYSQVGLSGPCGCGGPDQLRHHESPDTPTHGCTGWGPGGVAIKLRDGGEELLAGDWYLVDFNDKVLSCRFSVIHRVPVPADNLDQ